MKILPLLSIIALMLSGQWTSAADYTLAINHGRVIDPETGLDGIRHIGVSGGEIIEISEVPLQGSQLIDATGLVEIGIDDTGAIATS